MFTHVLRSAALVAVAHTRSMPVLVPSSVPAATETIRVDGEQPSTIVIEAPIPLPATDAVE
jgi:hypothetical protein